MLLVLGFLFTGVFGALLNNWVQDRFWRKQQEYTNQQNVTKTKLEVMETSLESAARVIAAGQDVVMAVDWKLDKAERDRRVQRWHKETARWQVEEKLIRARLRSHFRGATLHDALDALSAKIDTLTVNVSSMVGNWDAAEPEKRETFREAYFNAVAQVRAFRAKDGELNTMAALMLSEIGTPKPR